MCLHISPYCFLSETPPNCGNQSHNQEKFGQVSKPSRKRNQDSQSMYNLLINFTF